MQHKKIDFFPWPLIWSCHFFVVPFSVRHRRQSPPSYAAPLGCRPAATAFNLGLSVGDVMFLALQLLATTSQTTAATPIREGSNSNRRSIWAATAQCHQCPTITDVVAAAAASGAAAAIVASAASAAAETSFVLLPILSWEHLFNDCCLVRHRSILARFIPPLGIFLNGPNSHISSASVVAWRLTNHVTASNSIYSDSLKVQRSHLQEQKCAIRHFRRYDALASVGDTDDRQFTLLLNLILLNYYYYIKYKTTKFSVI